MPDGRAFELMIADRMRALGWQCEVTPSSGDFGADLICCVGSEVTVIQCKCYDEGSSIGVSAVQEACTAVRHFKADTGIVVYEGRPSRAARTLATSVGIKMFHANEVTSGWEFDRTLAGRDLRRQEEAKRRALEAAEAERRRIERDAASREADRVHAESLEAWTIEHSAWLKKSKSWEGGWSGASGIAAIFGALILVTGGSADDTLWGFGLLAASLAGFMMQSPGQVPIKPSAPSRVGSARASNAILTGGTSKAAQEPPAKARRSLSDQGNGRAVIQCSRCSKLLRVPASRRLRIGCPMCGLSEIRDTPVAGIAV